MATSKFTRFFQSAGNALTGAKIWLVPQADTHPTNALILTEDGIRDGVYYRDNVPDGEYKVYIDPTGEEVDPPTLTVEKFWIGEQRITDFMDALNADVETNNVSITKHGLTPKLPNDNTKFLDGQGVFDTVKDADLSLSDVTTNNVSTTKHGFAPKLPNDSTKFLNGVGAYAVPPGSGGVDQAADYTWTGTHKFNKKIESGAILRENMAGNVSIDVSTRVFIMLTPNASGYSANLWYPTAGQMLFITNMSSDYNVLLDGEFTLPALGGVFAMYDQTTASFRFSQGFPDIVSNNGKFLSTDGQKLLWATPAGGGGGGITKFEPGTYYPLYAAPPKVLTTFNTATYDFAGIIACNPTNGHLVSIFRKASSHVGTKGTGYIRHSTDGGTTWGSETEFLTDASYDIRNFGGGYDSTGRLHIFFGVYNYSGSAWVSQKYQYSDNDGTSWSSPATLDVSSNATFSPHGQLIEMPNGDLLQGWYGINGSTYKIYIYKSTNGGSSWSILTVYSGSTQLTEPSILHLGGGYILCVVRINNGTTYYQFLSADSGANWSIQGATSFGTWTYNPGSSHYPPSPCLFRFIYNGILVCGLYFTQRDATPNTQKVVYALAKDLINTGSGAWNASTIKTVHTFAGSVLCGMPTAVHNESFYGIINMYDHQGSSDADLVIVPSAPQGLGAIMNTLGV